MRRASGVLGWVLCAWAAWCVPAAAAAVAAAETVTAFHAELLTAVAEPRCERRRAGLAPVVAQRFDLPFIAQRALRRHWTTLDAAQREAFVAALSASVVATYATEFAGPDAVRFATGSTSALPSGDARVAATLTPKTGSAVALDYVLQARGEHWQIVNVLAEGVSDLALRATQYDGLMKSEGFAALLAKLGAQTAATEARCR